MRYGGAVPDIAELPVVGEFADLRAIIAATGAQQVLMLNLPKQAEDFDALVRACAATGCRLLVQNDLAFRLAHPLRQFMQDGYSFMAFQDEPLENPVLRGVKRAKSSRSTSFCICRSSNPPRIALPIADA